MIRERRDVPLSSGNGSAPPSVARLLTIRDPAEVEYLADALAMQSAREQWSGRAHRQLVEALLLCLTADTIRQDRNAENALCAALAAVGVMRRVSGLEFELLAESQLEPGDRAIVDRYRNWLPARLTTSDGGSCGTR
jgi:hypothetical protein